MKALFYPDATFGQLKTAEILQEIYTDRVYDSFLGDKKDLVIVEIGANIGLVTQRLQSHAKKIYAIEPNPPEFEALSANKDYNGWDNVELFQCAIAWKDGEMPLSVADTNRSGSTLMLGQRIGYNLFQDVSTAFTINTVDRYDESVSVQTKRLDTFFEENHIEHVDFMKMDVEGAEQIILKHVGFRNVAELIDAIEIEYHFPGWESLGGILKSLGFTGVKQKTKANVWLYQRGIDKNSV